jgi:hypothetical protein
MVKKMKKLIVCGDLSAPPANSCAVCSLYMVVAAPPFITRVDVAVGVFGCTTSSTLPSYPFLFGVLKVIDTNMHAWMTSRNHF